MPELSESAFGALALLAANGSGLQAASLTVQNVQFPTDPTFTQLLGINNTGALAGFHGLVTPKPKLSWRGPNHGNWNQWRGQHGWNLNGCRRTTHGYTDGPISVELPEIEEARPIAEIQAILQERPCLQASTRCCLLTNQNSQAVGINNAGTVAGFYLPLRPPPLNF